MDDLDREAAYLIASVGTDGIQDLDAIAAAKRIDSNVRPEAFYSFFQGKTDSTFSRHLHEHRKSEGNSLNVEAITLKHVLGGRGYDRALDARFNFGIVHKGKHIATLGFNPQPGTAAIVQIQGLGPGAGVLKDHFWEDALIAYTREWAVEAGIPLITVVGAKNNFWVKAQGHLSLERAIARYEEPAKRLGGLRMRNGNYLLSTTPAA